MTPFFKKTLEKFLNKISSRSHTKDRNQRQKKIQSKEVRLLFQEVLFVDMFFNKEMVTGTAIISTSTPAMTFHPSNTSKKTSRVSVSWSWFEWLKNWAEKWPKSQDISDRVVAIDDASM